MQQLQEQHRPSLEPWWHPLGVADEECWLLRVGPLSLYVQRQVGQWLVGSERVDDTEAHYRVAREQLVALPEDMKPARFVFKNAPLELCLSPRLLERPVVVRTNQPVQVPPGENITFYISSPVCVALGLPSLGVTLQEMPSVQLSDTWFGPSTQVGELCYAARTHARNSREEVPLRPHRAVTPITIVNQSKEFLSIEKLSIPVPFLAVYGAEDGTLWTDPVILSHAEGSPLVNFTIGKDKPEGSLLTAPRIVPPKGGVVRAFTNFFANS